MAGTQNLQNTAQQHQQINENENENKVTQKEDFMRVSNSQSIEKLNDSDPFDERVSSPTVGSDNQIQKMTREAGDGQNDNGTENIE